jgi:RNA polymerase sigma-70 factor (ECF subfamily)
MNLAETRYDLVMPANDPAPIDRELRQPPASDDDVALVARLLRKDERAFAMLVDRHHGTMLRVAQTMVPSRAVAEEVVQETWQGVLEGLPSFEGRSSLRTWIFRILVNRARTRGVREQRALPVGALSDADDAPELIARALRAVGRLTASATPETALLDGELRAVLEGAVEALPESMRAVLTMRDLAGWSAEEACAVLDLTEVNQRVLLHRARVRVRAALSAYLKGKP